MHTNSYKAAEGNIPGGAPSAHQCKTPRPHFWHPRERMRSISHEVDRLSRSHSLQNVSHFVVNFRSS